MFFIEVFLLVFIENDGIFCSYFNGIYKILGIMNEVFSKL